jgi:hypothetical protein
MGLGYGDFDDMEISPRTAKCILNFYGILIIIFLTKIIIDMVI